MANIKCPVCGEELSAAVDTCTYCGCKLKLCPVCGSACAETSAACAKCEYVFEDDGFSFTFGATNASVQVENNEYIKKAEELEAEWQDMAKAGTMSAARAFSAYQRKKPQFLYGFFRALGYFSIVCGILGATFSVVHLLIMMFTHTMDTSNVVSFIFFALFEAGICLFTCYFTEDVLFSMANFVKALGFSSWCKKNKIDLEAAIAETVSRKDYEDYEISEAVAALYSRKRAFVKIIDILSGVVCSLICGFEVFIFNLLFINVMTDFIYKLVSLVTTVNLDISMFNIIVNNVCGIGFVVFDFILLIAYVLIGKLCELATKKWVEKKFFAKPKKMRA